MRLSIISFALTLLLSPITASPVFTNEFTSLGCPDTTTPIATLTQQLEAFTDFNQLLYIHHQPATAFDKYIARNLINHAYDAPGDGAAVGLQTITPLIKGGTFEIQQTFVGQDHATVFFKATTPKGTAAAMEIYRMSGTCLVEIWVVLQPVTNSSNPHAFF